MARENALRTTMKLAIKVDLTDIAAVTEATRALSTLKEQARQLGFAIDDTVAKMGTFDFDAHKAGVAGDPVEETDTATETEE